MEFKFFTAGEDDNDRRLDRVIRKFMSADSLSGLYKAMRKGLIKVNDKKAEASDHIFSGDVIKIAEFLLNNPEQKTPGSKKIALPFRTILQTQDLLFVEKPYDVTVHGSCDSMDKTVAAWYETAFSDKDSLSFSPGPLHRLDRKTTGILTFSLSLKGARWFSENISTHAITKKYFGLVEGRLEKAEDWIDSIQRDFDDEASFQTVNIADTESISAKKAVTHVRPAAFYSKNQKQYTLVEYNIETGRTHQIRAQSAHHGHPLAGDTAYGGQKINAKQDFFLHAAELDFPEDNPLLLPLKINCKIPENFEFFLNTLVKE